MELLFSVYTKSFLNLDFGFIIFLCFVCFFSLRVRV